MTAAPGKTDDGLIAAEMTAAPGKTDDELIAAEMTAAPGKTDDVPIAAERTAGLELTAAFAMSAAVETSAVLGFQAQIWPGW